LGQSLAFTAGISPEEGKSPGLTGRLGLSGLKNTLKTRRATAFTPGAGLREAHLREQPGESLVRLRQLGMVPPGGTGLPGRLLLGQRPGQELKIA